MALTIQDLQPKNFTVDIDGVQIDCKPPKLSHILLISKVGEVLNDPKKATSQEIKQAEKDMDSIIIELMPSLSGIELSVTSILTVITQIMGQIEPADNKELNDKGVQFNTDPKVEKIG